MFEHCETFSLEVNGEKNATLNIYKKNVLNQTTEMVNKWWKKGLLWLTFSGFNCYCNVHDMITGYFWRLN